MLSRYAYTSLALDTVRPFIRSGNGLGTPARRFMRWYYSQAILLITVNITDSPFNFRYRSIYERYTRWNYFFTVPEMFTI
jgi:hypothetical protein